MIRRCFAPVVIPIVAAFAGGCSSPNPPVAELPPAEVSVVRPLRKPVQDTKQFLATLAAAESIEVRARVTGYLTEIKFKPGDLVAKGKELFVIDRRPFEAALKKAEGEVKVAEAQLKLARSDLERINVALKSSLGSVSAADKDKAAAQVDVSQAQLDALRAARDQANINLDYTVIKADVDGRIGRNLITAGNLVSADQTLLTKIVKPDPIFAYFDVDDPTVRQYARDNPKKSAATAGDAVPVELDLDFGGDSFPYKGVANFADPESNPSTGTLQARATFLRKDQLGLKDPKDPTKELSELLPGFTARLRLAVGPPTERILVPDRAIGTDQGQKYVYVVDADNKVEYRKVTPGNLYWINDGPYNADFRAISVGLDGTERIILNGLQRVRPGAKVDPEAVDPLSERPLSK